MIDEDGMDFGRVCVQLKYRHCGDVEKSSGKGHVTSKIKDKDSMWSFTVRS